MSEIPSLDQLLNRAKDAIASGVSSWRAATDDMASAKERARASGKLPKQYAPTWVHQMLKWRTEGYQDATPFARQSKASRQRAKGGRQAIDQERKFSTEQAEAAAARAGAEAAKSEAAKARADAERQREELEMTWNELIVREHDDDSYCEGEG